MSNQQDSMACMSEPDAEDRPQRVLLAEDDAEMRALLALTLRRAGYAVIEARSGTETLELLARGLIREPPIWFDLVICDVRMPGPDGLKILASLRLLPNLTPVILMTAFGSAAAHAAAMKLGAFAMVDKPFVLDDLMLLARWATSPFSRNKGQG